MEDFFRVGVIANTHGIRGEVKIFPTTDDVKRFDYLKEAYIDAGKEKIKVEVSNVRYFKNLVIVKFKGIDNINDIERYKGKDLLVTRENALPLEEENIILQILSVQMFIQKMEIFLVVWKM